MARRWLSVLAYFGLAPRRSVYAYSAFAWLAEGEVTKRKGASFYNLYPGRVIDYIGGAEVWVPDGGYSGRWFRVWSRGRHIDVENWGFA